MIVITAASGKLGKAVADELALRMPVGNIRLAARSTDKLDDFAQRGFDVVKGDYRILLGLRPESYRTPDLRTGFWI